MTMILMMLRVFPRASVALAGLALLLACVRPDVASAQTVVLHLKSGDQISGIVLSEDTNRVVISNAWVQALSIPLTEVSRRETATNVPTATAEHTPAAKSPLPPARALAAAKPTVKAPAKSKGTWHGQINVGMDAIFGTKDQKSYSGDGKLTYVLPYQSDPKKFFRNTVQASTEYQRTDGQESANRASGSNKSDFDLWKRYYAYAMEGVGYDEVKKINFRYQLGPGAGMHVLQRTNFVLNTEAGLNYEVQQRQGASNLKSFYLRLAEDFTWSLWRNLKLTENLQFYPDMERFGEYHNDFTSTLSYGFWKHLSLNLTVIDHYNTQLSPGVTPNQFEIRSSLGFTF